MPGLKLNQITKKRWLSVLCVINDVAPPGCQVTVFWGLRNFACQLPKTFSHKYMCVSHWSIGAIAKRPQCPSSVLHHRTAAGHATIEAMQAQQKILFLLAFCWWWYCYRAAATATCCN